MIFFLNLVKKIFQKCDHPRTIIENILQDDEQVEKFGKWAWGDNLNEINFMSDETVKVWNDLHSDKLKLESYGIPQEDIPKMIELWRQSKLKED
jgi:hypothetical protein